MRKINNIVLQIILAAGLMCLVGGFLIFVYAIESDIKMIYQIWPIMSLLLGSVLAYISMAFSHKTYLLFIGVEISFCSCYALVLERGVFPLDFVTGWPLFVVLTGIVLIITCFYSHKKLTPKFLVPAIVLILLGGFFMLFSLDIITMSFSKFFSVAGPVVMIMAGAASIVFFFIQGGHKELVIKEETADIEE